MTVEETFVDARSGFVESRDFVVFPRAHRVRFSQRIVCHLLVVLETVLIALLSYAILRTPQLRHGDFRYAVAASLAIASVVMTFAFLSGAATFDRFSSRLSLLSGALTGALLATFAAMLGGSAWLYSIFCAAAVFAGVYGAKIPSSLLKAFLLQRGHLTRLVAVAADDPAQRAALINLLRRRDDIEIIFGGSPANFDILSSLTQANQLDEIVLAGHEAREENIAALAGLAVTLVRVTPQDRLEHHVFDHRWGKKRNFGPWSAPAAVITQPPLRGWRGTAKRLMDIFGALFALIFFSPIMLICAIAVKLESPGPVFFIQERAGYRNKSFQMFKFRSMRDDRMDATGSQLTQRSDPRVTRVGAFLRRTSADELPQLFNVLLGDMSLVGPRPHPKGARAGAVLYDDLIPNFYSRYRMKPGITGLAQINGLRGNTETEQHLIDRFGTDLQYAAEWTPFLDIAILGRTVVHLCKGTNAY